jgi:hypothetical protein
VTARSLASLWLGLSLASCDKPHSADIHKDAAAPEARVARDGHQPRERKQDAPEALRTLLETAIRIKSPEAREKALADIAWNAIEIDPGLAQEAFQRLPTDSLEKTRLIQYYAMRLAEEDTDAALEWADGLGTEREIAAAKGQIALAIAETDPHRAASLLSESGIAGREFDVAVVQVIQRWAAKSASDSAAWVSSFPPGEAREAGIRVIAEQWLPHDASAAFAWLVTLKDTGFRNESARAMEGVILQQPADIRDSWLQHADAGIQSELEQQREQAIKDVGDNIPPLAK